MKGYPELFNYRPTTIPEEIGKRKQELQKNSEHYLSCLNSIAKILPVSIPARVILAMNCRTKNYLFAALVEPVEKPNTEPYVAHIGFVGTEDFVEILCRQKKYNEEEYKNLTPANKCLLGSLDECHIQFYTAGLPEEHASRIETEYRDKEGYTVEYGSIKQAVELLISEWQSTKGVGDVGDNSRQCLPYVAKCILQ